MNQGQRHHVAIGDVRDLMSQHSRDFFLGHAVEQAGGDSHQGIVLERARRKRVGLAFVDGDLGAADTSTVSQLMNRVDQPSFTRTARSLRVNHTAACAGFGHGLADQQGNDGARETDDDRKHQQHLDVQALLRHKPIHPQDA